MYMNAKNKVLLSLVTFVSKQNIQEALEFVDKFDFTELRSNLTFLFDIKIKLITKQNMIYRSSLTNKYLMSSFSTHFFQSKMAIFNSVDFPGSNFVRIDFLQFCPILILGPSCKMVHISLCFLSKHNSESSSQVQSPIYSSRHILHLCASPS